MQTPRKLLTQAADRLDLPADLMANLSRVELAGFCRLRVENHRGIRQFGTEAVTVELPEGSLTVRGTGLAIREMTAEALELSGQIHDLTLEEDGV